MDPEETRFFLNEAEHGMSDEEVRDALRQSIDAEIADHSGMWIEAVFDDTVVYYLSHEAHQDGDTAVNAYFRRSYSFDDAGTVTLGSPVRVVRRTVYEEVSESEVSRWQDLYEDLVPRKSKSAKSAKGGDANVGTEPELLSEGCLLESVDDDGWRWRVQLINAGVSKNRNEYPLEVLHRRASLYEGVPVYYSDGPDHDPKRRGFGAVAGWITEAKPNDNGVEGTLEINRGRPDLRDTFRQAWGVYQKTGRLPFGFSHVVPPASFTARMRRLAEGFVRRIEDFTVVESLDIVMRPSAGGELLGMVEAIEQKGNEMDELLNRLRQGERLTEAELTELKTQVGAEEYIAALEEGVQARQASTAVADPPLSESDDDDDDQDAPLTEASRVASLEHKLALMESESILNQTLAASKLPDHLQEAIREDFGGQVIDPDKLNRRIKRDRDVAAKLMESYSQPQSGRVDVEVTQDQTDKWQASMDGFFGLERGDGHPSEDTLKPWFQIPGSFRGLKEAYRSINGKHADPEREDRNILMEAISYTPPEWGLQESIQASTFANMLGDSIRRRAVAEYSRRDLQDFNILVSEVSSLTDFRTNRRIRMGGYGELPTVGEGGTYQNLTSPGDEEVTFVPEKRGGLEDLTFEALRNDDMGVVRQIPVKLGRAAILTLRRAVYIDTLVGNPAIYDGDNLFHANHNNTDTNALTAANLTSARAAMRKQAPYGVSIDRLGSANIPRHLIVPTELEETAFKLAQSGAAVISAEDATTPNMHRGIQVTVVDEFADNDDWFLAADPNNVPMLEIGYLDGRTEPELFVQDAQTVGSVFSADKITYKIRHIWGIAALEYRGFYRNVV